jgi:hypothetical protein
MKKVFLVIVLLAVVLIDVQAQCSMCKQVAESSLASGSNNIAAGLNNGILYLMGFPYLLLMAIVIILFKKPAKAKLAEMRDSME